MIEAPRLFTSHWRSPLLADVDAQVVGISRGVPRWSLPFRYRKLSALAPGDAAWAQQDQESFEESYTRQLEELGARTILEDLRSIARDQPAVLLCWEQLDGSDPTEFCHRRSLAVYLEREAGIEVLELRPGMLGKRQDTPQPALFDELPRGERA